MLIISGEVQVKPEARDRAIEVALKMAKASETEEGCISYRFYASLEDPNTFRIFEVWETEEALNSHFETPHMQEFRHHLPDIVAGPLDIKRYDVSKVSSA